MEIIMRTFDTPVRSLKIAGHAADLDFLSTLLSMRTIKIFDISSEEAGIQYFRGDEELILVDENGNPEHYRSEPGYCTRREEPECKACPLSRGSADCANVTYKPGDIQPGDQL